MLSRLRIYNSTLITRKMIREIINFTKNLIEDIPDILTWNAYPDKGLHAFIDIDQDGHWSNTDLKSDIDYVYYDGNNNDSPLLQNAYHYQDASGYITMNKVKAFDSKQKIHSCSPFAIAFNFNDKVPGVKLTKKSTPEEKEKYYTKLHTMRFDVVKSRLADYKSNALKMYGIGTKDNVILYIEGFFSAFIEIIKALQTKNEYKSLKEKDYVHIYLRSVPLEEQERLHNYYISNNIYSGEVTKDNKMGSVDFLTTYNSKKIFLRHQTSFLMNGVSQRFSIEDAFNLLKFCKLIDHNVLPSPLPIVVDQRELNKSIVKIFNEDEEHLSFRNIIKQLFEQKNLKYLSDFYLVNMIKTKDGYQLNDCDFVSTFHYYLDNPIIIANLMESAHKEDKTIVLDDDKKIDTIFGFESIAVRMMFDNRLVYINDDIYQTHYFDELSSKDTNDSIKGILSLAKKYRSAIYDFIYKSKANALNSRIIDDIMLHSILFEIHGDEINGRCEWNQTIKRKLNLWFCLYDYFTDTPIENINIIKNLERRNNMKTTIKEH